MMAARLNSELAGGQILPDRLDVTREYAAAAAHHGGTIFDPGAGECPRVLLRGEVPVLARAARRLDEAIGVAADAHALGSRCAEQGHRRADDLRAGAVEEDRLQDL